MIENFGNIFYLIIHILVTGLFGVYLVRIYFVIMIIVVIGIPRLYSEKFD